jgi:hypothetical protein
LFKPDDQAMNKPVKLQVNELGSWRDVMVFDADDGDDVLHQAGQLLQWSTNDKLRARAIIPGDTQPLEVWNKADGWREWGDR